MNGDTTAPAGRAWFIRKRKPEECEAQGREICYDLIVEDVWGKAELRDAASSREHAEKLLRFFKENEVTSTEAPYVMEDLLCDPFFIE